MSKQLGATGSELRASVRDFGRHTCPHK